MLRQVKFTGPDAQKLQNLQDNIQAALSPLEQSPIAGGQLVKAQFKDLNADTQVRHGLGTSSVGYFVVSPSAAGSVYTSPRPSPDARTILMLRSTGVLACMIYVFPLSHDIL